MSAAPKSLPAATRFLERYAKLSADLADVEESRSVDIATANASADAKAAPLIKELGDIEAALEPWWATAGADLANGKKSVQLGGCMIGTRMGKTVLAHTFKSDDAAAEELGKSRYKKQTTRTKLSLDKAATLKLLQIGGKAAEFLEGLGFSTNQEDRFFVDRVEQAATISA